MSPDRVLSLLSTLLLVACNDPDKDSPIQGDDSTDDSAVDSTSDSGADDSGTDTAPPIEFPWSTEGFWTDPGLLAELIYPTEFPTGPGPTWHLRIALSDDGVNWEADPRIIATGISSLNLLVVETDGGPGVVITGVLEGKATGYFDIPAEPQTVYGLASRDLETWSTFGLPIEGASYDVVIDPALWIDRTGALQAVWYGVENNDTDPAQLPGPHPLFGAPWSGSALQQYPEPVLNIEGTADPVICPMGGEDWMFTTEDTVRTIAARGADPARHGEAFEVVEGFVWDMVTVPWCRAEGEELVVIGQTGGGRGPPEQMIVRADGSTEARGALYAQSPFMPESCTSPAVGRFGDRWLLICAVDAPPDP